LLDVGYGPDPLQRQLGLKVLIMPVIVFKEMIDERILIPEPNTKEVISKLPIDGRLESTP